MLGELYKDIDNEKAKSNFQKAYGLAKTQTEKQVIREKMKELNLLLRHKLKKHVNNL